MARMKSSTKMKVWIVVVLLIVSAALILLGNVSKGFQNMNPGDWKLREANEENLYQALDFADVDSKLENGGDGITVTLEEDNVLKVNGTAEIDKTILVGTTILKAGTSYVFGSDLENGTNKTIYLRVVNTANDEVLASNYNAATVISGDELIIDTTVRIEIVIAEKTSINNLSLEVVLCEGDSADDLVDFYK